MVIHFNVNNNIQGINGDLNSDGEGTEIHTLEIPEVTHYEEKYVKKVIDSVNDLEMFSLKSAMRIMRVQRIGNTTSLHISKTMRGHM